MDRIFKKIQIITLNGLTFIITSALGRLFPEGNEKVLFNPVSGVPVQKLKNVNRGKKEAKLSIRSFSCRTNGI